MNNALHPNSGARTVKYHVQTSDVLQDMQVNVSLEGTSEIIWHKERFLEEKEIVEHIIHNATNTICWTTHRPLRGWYIRVRSPSFPPGAFIQLAPVPTNAPYHVEAALGFSSRTNIPILGLNGSAQDRIGPATPRESVDSQSTGRSSIHSYPPTPSASTPSSSPPKFHVPLDSTSSASSIEPTVSSPSPPNPLAQSSSSAPSAPVNAMGSISSASSSTSTLVSPTPPTSVVSSKAKLRPRPLTHIPSSQITPFILAPSAIPPSQNQANASASSSTAAPSFFSRALSVLKNHRPSHSNSFTLSRIQRPPNARPTPTTAVPPTALVSSGPSSPPPAYASTAALISDMPQRRTSTLSTHALGTQSQLLGTQPVVHTPLLTFHDQTSLLTVRSLNGLLEIDVDEERQLGVDTSFWVAIALTYLEFLEERESYLAAVSD
ncbi:hypothetical protein CPB83DRAFT_853832 [Crepidotus variabilis]|uniref:Uncharacterized protein n=1 Tax=Crepidotus variabilis TaxID=179855 RepID=A0A9P6JQK7_9AGAR|nr:hypothetical protein CPB83DRAFT_853832 [Crepidotus variabilis]